MLAGKFKFTGTKFVSINSIEQAKVKLPKNLSRITCQTTLMIKLEYLQFHVGSYFSSRKVLKNQKIEKHKESTCQLELKQLKTIILFLTASDLVL